MYENLLKQFDMLPERKKNALIVYKTRLGLLMNDLDNNPNYADYYDRYYGIYDNPINSVINSVIFNHIDMSSFEDFIKSINRVKMELDEATSIIKVPEDIIVYRAVSSNDEIVDISKSNIISTSLSFVETNKYAKGGEKISIFEIRIPAGSPVGVCPYRIMDDTLNNRLIIKRHIDEEEIIINANNFEFEQVEEYPGAINFYVYNAKVIDNKKARN